MRENLREIRSQIIDNNYYTTVAAGEGEVVKDKDKSKSHV